MGEVAGHSCEVSGNDARKSDASRPGSSSTDAIRHRSVCDLRVPSAAMTLVMWGSPSVAAELAAAGPYRRAAGGSPVEADDHDDTLSDRDPESLGDDWDTPPLRADG